MKKFALLGHKLTHSISNIIHNARFSDLELDANYVIDDVEPDLLNSRLCQYDGVNVTIPYKQSVIKYLDSLSEEAKAIGAVNTVANCNGKLFGYNTDIVGLKYVADKIGADLSGRVLILGYGGVAQTAIHLTLSHGADVFVATRKDGLHLNNVKFIDYNTANSLSCDVVINCTPVGMFPNVNAAPIEDLNCNCCIDLIYNPLNTRLLEIAEYKGIKCIGGIDMLVVQALESEKIWFSVDYNEEDVERMVKLARKEIK